MTDESEIEPEALELIEALETLETAKDCRQIIAQAARLKLRGVIDASMAKTFNDAALGCLRAIDVAGKQGGGTERSPASVALTEMAEDMLRRKAARAKRARRQHDKRRGDGPAGTGEAGGGRPDEDEPPADP